MKNLAIILPDGSVLDGIEKISFQLFNSIFDEEVLRGSYSSSLDIPNTPGNRKAMGFAEMPESNIKPSRTIKNVKARIAGQLVNCTLKILNATDKAYKATLLFGWGQFVEQLAETRINQLSNLGTLYLGGDLYENWTNEDLINPNNQFAYMAYLGEIWNTISQANRDHELVAFPQFTHIDNEKPTGTGEEYYTRNLFKTQFDDDPGQSVTAGGSMQPAFYMTRLIELGLGQFAEISGDFLEMPDVKRILLFFDKYKFRIYYDRYLYPKILDLKEYLSNMDCLQFVKLIKDTFHLPIDVNLFSRKIIFFTWDKIFDNQNYVDWTDKLDGTISDVRSPTDDLFNTSFYFVNKEEFSNKGLADYANRIIKPAVNTIAELLALPLPDPMDIRFVISSGLWFEPDTLDDGTINPNRKWKAFAVDARDFGNGSGKSKKVICPTFETTINGEYVYNPITFENNKELYFGYFGIALLDNFQNFSEASTSRPFFQYFYEPKAQRNLDIRMAFWLGKCDNINDPNNYCLWAASSVGRPLPHRFNPITPRLPEPSFILHQNNNEGRPRVNKPGLYQKFGSRKQSFLNNTKKIRAKFKLSEADIVSLNNTQKIKVGNNLYLFDTMNGSFPIEQSTEVELYWLAPGS